MPVLTRDPVSELLDGGARILLERAFAARGGWVQTRLADPSPEHRSWAASIGIDLDGPDNAPTRSGRRKDMRSRWGRAFTRALYYQLKWYGSPGRLRKSPRIVPYDRPMEVEIGRRVPALGVIPAGRIVRIRLLRGGQVSRKAVRGMPRGDRIFAPQPGQPERDRKKGKTFYEPGARWADAEKRDWA